MRADTPCPLTVVVPAFNEEGAIGTVVQDVHGSRDRTGAIADELAGQDAALTVCHQANQGLGGALCTGFGRARGEFVLTWPADMPAARADLAPFAEKLGAADVLVGVRSRRAGYNPLMRFNSWLYPQLVAALFGLRLRDVNWIQVYRTALIRRVEFTQRGARAPARPRGGVSRGALRDAAPRRRHRLGVAPQNHVADAARTG